MEPRVRKSEVRAKSWKCNTCSSTFQRLDHLKRHALTHDTAKDHVCSFCDSAFSRGDVLRRHWKSCKARLEGGHAIPEPERGGKHKRACDSCASLRKACNGELPCSECVQRERECTYQRLVEDEPLPQAPFESQDAGYSATHTKRSEPTWDLGPSTLYPSSVEIFARRHRIALGSSDRSTNK